MILHPPHNRSPFFEIPWSNLFPEQCQMYLQILAEKDIYTYIHSQYTGQLAVAIGTILDLSEKTIKDLYIAGWLHDLGKILVPRQILRKPAALSDAEYKIVKHHVSYGLKILSDLQLPATVKNAIKYHHERWDGKGYPSRTTGENTPLAGRILQIADAFSAMTIKRVYRKPLSKEDALDEIRKNRGSQFDPELADRFIDIIQNQRANAFS